MGDVFLTLKLAKCRLHMDKTRPEINTVLPDKNLWSQRSSFFQKIQLLMQRMWRTSPWTVTHNTQIIEWIKVVTLAGHISNCADCVFEVRSIKVILIDIWREPSHCLPSPPMVPFSKMRQNLKKNQFRVVCTVNWTWTQVMRRRFYITSSQVCLLPSPVREWGEHRSVVSNTSLHSLLRMRFMCLRAGDKNSLCDSPPEQHWNHFNLSHKPPCSCVVMAATLLMTRSVFQSRDCISVFFLTCDEALFVHCLSV